jgi:NADH pyrophosphatase NudC (nudix superfamily)
MCYNHRAVERARKQEVASVQPKPAGAVSPEAALQQENRDALADAEGAAIAGNEDASRYCPVCSQRLESRRCKLICPVCGYYMSCADYY